MKTNDLILILKNVLSSCEAVTWFSPLSPLFFFFDKHKLVDSSILYKIRWATLPYVIQTHAIRKL